MRTKRRAGRPPGSSSAKTRAHILRAARVCFAAKGFGAATNRDIASAAGLTPAAIYQYFDSKVALYVETAHEAVAEVTAHIQRDVSGQGAATTAFADIVRSMLALHERDASLGGFLSAVPIELKRHPELARRFQPEGTELAALITATVAKGVDTGELDPKDARGAGEMFLACVMGLAQYAATGGGGREPAMAFAELLEGGLFARPAARRDEGAKQSQGKRVRRERAATRS